MSRLYAPLNSDGVSQATIAWGMVTHKGPPALETGYVCATCGSEGMAGMCTPVRGDTCKPRAEQGAHRDCSSPHVGLSQAMRRMSARRSVGKWRSSGCGFPPPA